APRADSPLAPVAAEAYEAAARAWDEFAPSQALEATWRLVRETNALLEATEPWKMDPGPEVEAVLGDALEALRIVSVLASPAIPAASEEAWRRIGLPGSPSDQRLPAAAAWGGYPGGLPVTKGAPLFPRLTPSAGAAVAPRWTDDHCHLGWEGDGPPDPAAVDATVAEARAAGVERMITVGTDRRRSAEAGAVAARHPAVAWATAGGHPHEAEHGLEGSAEPLGEPGVVAVGECGLDYHYDHSPRPVQREVFAAQVALAHEHDLALVVHTREAWEDTFAVLDAEGVPERTVFHCFTGGPAEARACLDRGGHLSFSGIVTFTGADDVRA